MNFFGNTGDLARGMMNLMNNNNIGYGNEKEIDLRKKLESCTYPDETKYMIEKAAKQVFHVYPFFNADILMFNQNGFPRRHIELKGILEVDIKSKTCKVDFNMMLPSDYPRSPPYVRIVNRNPEYRVDPFYQSLQSKSDKSSYILNQKLNSCKNWHPSNSLVNIVIECYDILKSRFPFTKISNEPAYNGNNVWGGIYNNNANNNPNNYGGGGFVPQPPPVNPNNAWGNGGGNGGWGNNNWTNPNPNPNTWGTNNVAWGGNNNGNSWGNNNQWGGNNQMGNMGGMGGIINSNPVNIMATGQKYAGKQKQTLSQISVQYIKVLDKNQVLDATKKSLESEQSKLRKQNFEMTNFLSANEQASIPDLANIVQPSNQFSEQILDLVSSLKAREQCVSMLELRFNQEQISLQEFMKHLRKVEETRFQEKVLLQKCIKHA